MLFCFLCGVLTCVFVVVVVLFFLQSHTSTSSEDSEDAPPVPKKTNDAYLAPGKPLTVLVYY